MNSFYLHRTNWHSWPPLSRLLCWIGRHDYEFLRADDNWGTLVCMYCGAQKRSYASS